MTKKIIKENFSQVKIGLEIHITLKSEKKIFNWIDRYDGKFGPNSEISPWELGYLGTLPIINPEAIKLAIRLSESLEMKISKDVVFDRKIYNYFDLPKGFQITQLVPFATQGIFRFIDEKGEISEIKIKSIHLEEDTGKSIYSSEGIKIDFNRSGNPLIELVTEPIFSDIKKVCEFVKNLQFLLRYLDVSEAKMEKGQLRTDLNFSLKFENDFCTPRYEIKNLNSIKNLEKSLNYELEKNKDIFLMKKKFPPSTTLNFDELKQITVANREKTEYFFLPEVNIIPIRLNNGDIKKIRSELPKLPWDYWKEIRDKKIKINQSIYKFPFILKSFSIIESSVNDLNYLNDWTIFYLNFLSDLTSLESFGLKRDSYLDVFLLWKNKNIRREELQEELRFLKEQDDYLFKKDKYKKKNEFHDESSIKLFLEQLWNDDVKKDFSSKKEKVFNYLLGKVKKDLKIFSVEKVISSIKDFLAEKK